MKKYIVITIISLGIIGLYMLQDDPYPKQTSSPVQESSIEGINSKISKKSHSKKGMIFNSTNINGIFKENFGFKLEKAGISKYLQSAILYIIYPGFFDQKKIDQIEKQIEKRIKERPGEVFDEISGLISNYREKLPTKVKGLLFMKLADVKGYEKEIKEMALNELKFFTDSTVLSANKLDSPEITLVESVSQIYETYLHVSKGTETDIESETLMILKYQSHKNIKESIVSTFMEVDPENGLKLLKVLKDQGELPPAFEALVKKMDQN